MTVFDINLCGICLPRWYLTLSSVSCEAAQSYEIRSRSHRWPQSLGGCLRFIQAAIHAAMLVTCIKSYTETQASPRHVIQYCGGERDSSWRSLNITFRSTSSWGTRSMWLFLAIFLLLFIPGKCGRNATSIRSNRSWFVVPVQVFLLIWHTG